MTEIDLDEWLRNTKAMLRQRRLETLKRWGQETCEHCNGPLETLFNDEGRDPIRICMRCEVEANERDYSGT